MIDPHAINDSRNSAFFIFSKQSFLKNSANVLRKSDNAAPNERDIRIFLQPSTSRPDDPDPYFVSIDAFKMRDHPYLHILLAAQVLSVLALTLLTPLSEYVFL